MQLKRTRTFLITFKDILICLYFFIFYLSVSIWGPFFNIYLKDMGFTGTQVGIIAAVYQAALFFVVPIWGIFSDRKGIRVALIITLTMSSLLIFTLRYVHPFYAILGYMMILAFFHHPMGSLLDSLAIQQTQQTSRFSYGAFRVWGSIGWAIGCTLMGRYLITHELAHIFPIAAIFYFITLLSSLALKSEEKKEKQERDFVFSHLVAVFGKKQIMLLLILLIFYGIGISPLYVFINLYYRDIGASNNIIGIAFAVQALSELPFFFFGHKLVDRFGAEKLLLGVVLAAIFRMCIYGFISNPSIAVMLGLMQGITLSLFWVGIVSYLHPLIPVKWRSTGQSLIWAFHLGAGITIGNITIGSLSDHFRMQQVMFMGAGFSLLVFVMFIIYFKIYSTAKPGAPIDVSKVALNPVEL